MAGLQSGSCEKPLAGARLGGRLRGIAFWLLYGLSCTGIYLLTWLPRKIRPRPVARFCGRLVGWLALLCARLACGVRVHFHGKENLPKAGEGVIVIANHQSQFETLLLAALIPTPCIVLKMELLSLPFFGPNLRDGDNIPIDRAGGPKALRMLLKKTKAALQRGDNVIIFPQGTRAPPDAEIKLRPGIVALLHKTTKPLVSIAHNSGKIWRTKQAPFRPGKLWVDIKRIPPVAGSRAAIIDELQAAMRTHYLQGEKTHEHPRPHPSVSRSGR